MADEFDPYHRWLGIPPEEQPPHHYRLLGINAFEANPEVIRDAAQQRMAHVRTYQLGEFQALSQRILNELAAAKACLSDPQQKAAYDTRLRQKLAQPTKAPIPEVIKRIGNARLEQFVQHIMQSGLLSGSDISAHYEGLPPEKHPQDSQALARALVKANQLTKYQAELVYQGKIKGLAFGDYRVLDKLGEGGMGMVFKAQHRRMKRLVAVKMILGAAMKSPGAVKRFYREVEAAAQLQHPNIVTAYDASEYEGVHYLVMQFVEGKDLGAVVKERGPLPIAQAVDYIIQAARGLHYAHKQNIIHRDIKPANLLVDKEGTVKILDMGLARMAGLVDEEDRDRLTQSGQVMGTVDYMAPEQALDTHNVDARTDIYSLGCTLYRLLTGEAMYKGESLAKILIAHQMSPVPSLRNARNDVPPPLDAVFQKMVAKKPEDRYPTMAEVIAALETCLSKGTEPASSVREEAGAVLPAAGNLSALKTTTPPSAATATKRKAEPRAQATLSQHAAAADTSKQLESDEKPQPVPRKKKTRLVVIGLGLLGVIGVIAFAVIIRIRHPDGTETTVTVPNGSNVTVGEKGDVDVSVKGQGSKHDMGAPPPAVAPFGAAKAKQHQEAWAKHLGTPVKETNSIGMPLVLIPPGEFEMGSTPEEITWALEEGKKINMDKTYLDRVASEAPRQHVKITRPFYLAVYPVTQGEYEKVMGMNPSSFTEKQIDASAFKPPLTEADLKRRLNDGKKVAGKDTSRHPVETVYWGQAGEFCRRLSAMPAEQAARRVYRLPTEAEWEYACRAGTTTCWYCGDDEAGLLDVAWFRNNSGEMTHPVGEKKPNAWGLYDMHGNVLQWYAGSAAWRGGSFFTHASDCRSACRTRSSATYCNHGSGFRVVLEVGGKAESGKGKVEESQSPLSRRGTGVGGERAAPAPAVAPFDATKAKQHQAAWAEHLGVSVEQTNSIGMKLALIPPGEFQMGSKEEEITAEAERAKKNNKKDVQGSFPVFAEGPRHAVKITNPFYLGMCSVTQADYEKVMGTNPSAFTEKQIAATGFKPPLSDAERKAREVGVKKVAGKDTSRHPVETVSWDDANEFCRKLSAMPAERAARRTYRLPTEAEWEYACRAGTTTRWYCGDDEAGLPQFVWFKKGAAGMTHPVGEKKPNAWGLYDMHGNVSQWCSDRFSADYYKQSPPSDPTGATAGYPRVARGGHWSASPSSCRSAFRNSRGPGERNLQTGFRVVADVEGKAEVGRRKVEGSTTGATPIPNPHTPSPRPAVAPFDAAKAKQRQEALAKQLRIAIATSNSIGMKFMLIPPGEFMMGSTPEEIAWALEQGRRNKEQQAHLDGVSGEGPRHHVKITKPFSLGACPVTQKEFSVVMGWNPSAYSATGRRKYVLNSIDTSRHPVDMVSWEDASEFCRQLSALPEEVAAHRTYRLPTEAEWEYACRAGSTTCWWCGDDEAGLHDCAWYEENAHGMTHPVGEKKPNAWGLYDMYGNVRQWCADWFNKDYYQRSPPNDPRGPAEGTVRVLRGGAFASMPLECRSASRYSSAPSSRTEHRGLRVVVEH